MAEATVKLPEDLDDYVNNPADYDEFLKEPNNWKCVPSVNYTPLTDLKCEQLVRFRGMIQDMSNVEIYVDVGQMVKKINPNSSLNRRGSFKYRECLKMEDDEYFNHGAAENRWCDRRPITLVSVPGLNSWVIEYESGVSMELDEPTDNGIPKKKPMLEDCTSPIKERPSKVCVAKLYKDFDKYSLCSVVEVLGYLFKYNGYQAHSIIHAIAVHEVSHCNPLLDMRLKFNIGDLPNMEAIQCELHKFLSICMLNDQLAAKYLLCHLFSSM